ncbi:MAG: hypothetical protein BBJ57_02030 [Desulfobacterales bacterium PC51MH44]|nr:MAG: hypothetical protein BBJ57_02030 [Desulfobacterales bacterium PC51MH44]
MIDYDYYSSALADELDKMGEENGFFKAKAVLGSIKYSFAKKTKEETENRIEEILYLARREKFSSIALMQVIIESLSVELVG